MRGTPERGRRPQPRDEPADEPHDHRSKELSEDLTDDCPGQSNCSAFRIGVLKIPHAV